MEQPSPAPCSTNTSWPRCTSSRAPAGVSATRYSSVLISLATPIRIPARDNTSYGAPRGPRARRHARDPDADREHLLRRLARRPPLRNPQCRLPGPLRRPRLARLGDDGALACADHLQRRDPLRLAAALPHARLRAQLAPGAVHLHFATRRADVPERSRARALRVASALVAQIEQQPELGLQVVELADARLDLVEGPLVDLHVLALVEILLAAWLDAGGEVERHVLADEAGRRPAGDQRAPLAADEPALLLELPLRRLQGILPVLARAGRQLEQFLARGLAPLPDKPDLPLRVDGDDRDRAGMVDDLLAVLLDDLQVRHRSSTSSRCSGVNHGGSPARAFSAVRSGRFVAGMTRSTRSSESTHLSSACGHDSTPSSRSAAGSTSRRTSSPSANGRITITATPSSAASCCRSRSTSRSCGLYGSCTVSNRPVRSARASSPNALDA